MTDLRVLAFDLGTNMAWAGTSVPGHKVLDGKTRPQKLASLAQMLNKEWLGTFDVVVFERPFARGQGATRMLWGIAGMIEAAATLGGVPTLDYTPGEIKKWATGKGDAEKNEMIAAAQFMGYGGDNEHEADAFCLLQFAQQDLYREPKKCQIVSTIQVSRLGQRKAKSATSKLSKNLAPTTRSPSRSTSPRAPSAAASSTSPRTPRSRATAPSTTTRTRSPTPSS